MAYIVAAIYARLLFELLDLSTPARPGMLHDYS
jgi:hypothetical protein